MEKGLTLLRPQMGILVAENELNGVEKVGLARPVPTDDDVVAGVKGLNHRLLPVGLEALDDHLLDVHLVYTSRAPRSSGRETATEPGL